MKRPIWVAIGLFMLETREQAMMYLVASAVGSVLVFVGTMVVMPVFFGFPHLRTVVGASLLGAILAAWAGLYWLSIRWMDKHGSWE